MNKLRVLSLFSGIGAFEMALKNIGVDYELIGFSEIDKYAIKSYCAIHDVNQNLNLGDITKIDIANIPDIDMITHGSPCQSISCAGLQHGADKNSGTRSSLMWNTVEIIKKKLPKYVIWENVKNLLNNKHIHNLNEYIEELNNLGYKTHYRVLNAKYFGVSQSRERIYVVSILGDDHYDFPEEDKEKEIPKLKDFLEKEAMDRFYIKYDKPLPVWDFSKNIIGRLEIGSYDMGNRVYGLSSCGFTLRAKKNDQKILDEKGLRYLTPRECFRLMGMDDDISAKLTSIGISDNQQYKIAGNSIVVPVLEEIFKNLFKL